jgi:MFS family permease
LAPLRSADYRRLWIGQVVSVVGDKINQIAMAIVVYAITGSMLQMGIMLGVTALPAALIGIPAGAYVDRWDRRITMLVADIVRALVVVSIPFVVRYGVIWIYVLAFIASTVALFFVPAKRSLIPDLVPPDELMAANSLDNASEAVAELVGLAVGAAVVAILGYKWAFRFDALTFVVSAIMILLIRYRQPAFAPSSEKRDVIKETLAGVRAIFENDVMRQLSVVYVASALFASASIAVCYALALDRYHAGAPGLAMLDAASAVGILLGSVLVVRSPDFGAGVKFLTGITLFGAFFALLVFAVNIWIAMVLIAICGVANMYFLIPATTMYQTRSERGVRGRVMAASTSATRVAMVIGMIATGALADKLSVANVAAAVGIAALIVAGYGWTQTALREA